jgi:uncharacterized membrane-anchored protein YjiN (DUF445 family)
MTAPPATVTPGRPDAQSAPPPVRGEEERIRQLRAMKRRATGLLVVMGVVFFLVTLLGHGRGWTAYLQAAVEASLVGGLADWFAVTALFRHPLGVPIPHTAVIVERKDQFGQTLGDFVQQNFLSADVLTARARSARLTLRMAQWLADEQNAQTVASYAGDLLVGLADLVRDEDIHPILEEEMRRLVEALPVAPLAGRLLRLVTADGRHQELFDSVVQGLAQVLEQHREEARQRFRREAPWWLPEAVDDRIFDRLFDGIHSTLEDIAADPDHQLREQFNNWIDSLVDRLEHSPEMQTRGEELKQELLKHAELRNWASSLWADAKTALRAQAADPESTLRRRLADAVVTIGQRLCADEALGAKADELLESGARYVAEHFHEEISSLISGTITRWDGQETSRKLELLLGRDLQYIRINGTVVGGLAGLGIYSIARAIR